MHQRVQVSARGGANEPLCDTLEDLGIHVEAGRAGLLTDVASGTAGELPARRGRSPDDRAHGLEGEPEDVVEHEGGAFGGAQALEHHHQRHAHAVVQRHAVGGIGFLALGIDQRLGQPGADVGLPARTGGAQLVQTEPSDDHDQPAPHVLDVAQVDAHEPGERLLHHVLRVAQAPEHPVGHVERQLPVFAPHGYQPCVAPRIAACLCVLAHGWSSRG